MPTHPKIVTDRESGWRYYSIHLAATYVMKEALLVGNYRRCIELAFSHGSSVSAIMDRAELGGLDTPYRKNIEANAEGLSKWAKDLEKDDYHEIYVHSFIGLWSAFEAGIENMLRDYMRNSEDVAERFVGKVNSQKTSMRDWPWSEERTLRFAKRMMRIAEDNTPNGKYQVFDKIQTVLSWLGIHIDLDAVKRDHLSEAKLVRNILLHRNGEVGVQDAADCPALKDHIGMLVPFNRSRFFRYSSAVSSVLSKVILAAGDAERRKV